MESPASIYVDKHESFFGSELGIGETFHPVFLNKTKTGVEMHLEGSSRWSKSHMQMAQEKLQVTCVECHSHSEQDWYAVTVAVDMLAFLYTILFYQVSVLSL